MTILLWSRCPKEIYVTKQYLLFLHLHLIWLLLLLAVLFHQEDRVLQELVQGMMGPFSTELLTIGFGPSLASGLRGYCMSLSREPLHFISLFS